MAFKEQDGEIVVAATLRITGPIGPANSPIPSYFHSESGEDELRPEDRKVLFGEESSDT